MHAHVKRRLALALAFVVAVILAAPLADAHAADSRAKLTRIVKQQQQTILLLQGQLNLANATLEHHDSLIAVVQETLAAQAMTLAAQGARLDAAEQALATLQATSAQHEARLDTLAGAVENLAGRADAASSRLDRAEGDISRLQSSSAAHAARLDTLTERADAHARRLDSAEAAIGTLTQTQADQGTRISAAEQTLAGVQTRQREVDACLSETSVGRYPATVKPRGGAGRWQVKPVYAPVWDLWQGAAAAWLVQDSCKQAAFTR
jgi:chromosome segregation ATPase